MSERTCKTCKRPFTLDARDLETEARIHARWGDSHGVKVCHSCVLAAIMNMAAESVFEMTDEEIEAELRADGVDVEAFAKRSKEKIEEMLAAARSTKPGKP